MAQRNLKFQFSFRILLVVCLVCGVLTVSFAGRIRQTIESMMGPEAVGSPFEVTRSENSIPAWDSWQAMHAFYENEFVNSEGFGLSRIIQFDAPEYRPIEINGQLYSVVSLELVSLEKHNQPQVYVNTAGYPVRKHYKNAKTRELTEFEAKSLRQLVAGKDVVFNGDKIDTRFVGAIRAQKSCLQCHDAKIGKLLGAFAYHLSPIGQQSLITLPE